MESIQSEKPTFFRGIIQGKTRLVIAWIFAILLALSAKNPPLIPGILLCFIGASIRYWASGFLRKDSRLAVGGPYAYMRNPLYFGTFLMALGTAWAVGSNILLIGGTVLFAILYHYIILDEETKLKRMFGANFDQYCALVPRFFPRPIPARKSALEMVNSDPNAHDFDSALAHKNKAYEAYLAFIGLIGSVYLLSIFYSKFQ